MVQMLISIIVVALSLYLTIFIHEWCHFLVAKRLGINATILNIGIGPILLSHKGTLEINIRLMPIGGYLDIPDMMFFKQTGISRRKRCLIALAGPFGNLLLCFYLAALLAIIGIPIYHSSLHIGYVSSENPELAIKPGDEVALVNGVRPDNWNSVMAMVYESSKTNITMVTRRGGEMITNDVPILVPGLVAPRLPMAPAQKLYRQEFPIGKQKILLVNGSPYFSGETFAVHLKTNGLVKVTYLRGQDKVTEDWKVTESLIYYIWEYDPPVVYVNPLTIMGNTAWQMCKAFGLIVTPKSNLNVQNLSGPLTTMLYLHRYFDTDMRLGLFLMMALNLNLMIFNLMPIYPMDGSHVAVALLENTRFLRPFKKCMIFVTWGVLMMLVWMLLLDVIKYALI